MVLSYSFFPYLGWLFLVLKFVVAFCANGKQVFFYFRKICFFVVGFCGLCLVTIIIANSIGNEMKVEFVLRGSVAKRKLVHKFELFLLLFAVTVVAYKK